MGGSANPVKVVQKLADDIVDEVTDTARDFGDDPLGTILDTTVNVATGGTLGFEDGLPSIGANPVLKPQIFEQVGEGLEFLRDEAVGGLKDILGATALEEANKAAEGRVQEEKEKRLEDRTEAQNQSARDQLRRSRSAERRRRRSGGRSTVSQGGGIAGASSRTSQLGDDEQDFLGL